MTSPTQARDTAFATAEPQLAPDNASVAPAGFHLFSYLLGLVTALTLVGGALFLLRRPEPPPIALQAPPTAAPTATPSPTPEPGPITVFVSGAVEQPGLYVLAADARVGDAITAAGGLADDANGALVNQAEPIWDGAQVHVPAAAADAAPGTAPVPVMAAAPAAGVSGASRAPDLGNLATAGLINLNSASAGELETLPGIGPSKAAAIIDNRPYASVDELERVPGIGAKTLDQLRALVTAP